MTPTYLSSILGAQGSLRNEHPWSIRNVASQARASRRQDQDRLGHDGREPVHRPPDNGRRSAVPTAVPADAGGRLPLGAGGGAGVPRAEGRPASDGGLRRCRAPPPRTSEPAASARTGGFWMLDKQGLRANEYTDPS